MGNVNVTLQQPLFLAAERNVHVSSTDTSCQGGVLQNGPKPFNEPLPLLASSNDNYCLAMNYYHMITLNAVT